MSATEIGTGTGFRVYRLFDDQGRLLYVGVPESPRTRLRADQCRGAWQAEIAGVHVRTFETLASALADEAVALATEQSIWNLKDGEGLA